MIAWGVGVFAIGVGAQQADPAILAELQQMSTALVIVAVAAVLFGLMCVGILIAVLRLVHSVTRLTGKIEQQIDQLSPRAAPLIDRVSAVATDARDVTDTVRRRVNELMDTVSSVNQSLRQAAEATEVRVREFGAVVDVVKAEAEEILMDTAATARGIHKTAEVLRTSPARRALYDSEEESERPVRRARARTRAPDRAARPAPEAGESEPE
jgi:uncharacterized protein YoxC